MARHDREDAFGHLERTCRNYGLLSVDGFYSKELAEHLPLFNANFTAAQLYMVSALVEKVLGTALNLNPAQTAFVNWEEATKKVQARYPS